MRAHLYPHNHTKTREIPSTVTTPPAVAFVAGSKRGLVARFCEHVRLFSPRARHWLYNHGTSLEQYDPSWQTKAACRALASGREAYVPMVYSLTTLAAQDSDAVHGARARASILGMNEPTEHNNQSAQSVAAHWNAVESIADRFSPPLLIGSPSPGGLDVHRSQRWLADFFQHCRQQRSQNAPVHGCRVDFVAVHWYECDGRTASSAEASARAMMSWLETIWRQSEHKPIWLTEFNCGDGAAPQPYANQSAANHLRFMKAALPKLEAASFVQRYSWFQTWQRHTPWHPGNNPGCSLTSLDGMAKSELGRFYDAFRLMS